MYSTHAIHILQLLGSLVFEASCSLLDRLGLCTQFYNFIYIMAWSLSGALIKRTTPSMADRDINPSIISPVRRRSLARTGWPRPPGPHWPWGTASAGSAPSSSAP